MNQVSQPGWPGDGASTGAVSNPGTRRRIPTYGFRRRHDLIYALLEAAATNRFIAGACAGAWASCRQFSFASQDHHRPRVTAHNHDHHSHSNQNHSHNSVIHCPNLDEFVPAANFSARKDNPATRVPIALIPEVHLQFTLNGIRSIHGPPGFSSLNSIRPYLLLSVFRI